MVGAAAAGFFLDLRLHLRTCMRTQLAFLDLEEAVLTAERCILIAVSIAANVHWQHDASAPA